MRKLLFPILFLILVQMIHAQKKPLDHSVYDSWQSIGEKLISSNGRFVAYTINPQEGDGMLVIQASDNSYKREIPRGYSVTITPDSRFVIFKIKPWFKDTREAKIKKKKPEEMPKDSLGIFNLSMDSLLKIAEVKSYKTPQKTNGWLAYLHEKSTAPASSAATPDSASQINKMISLADSLAKIADSIRAKAVLAKSNGIAILKPAKSTENKSGNKAAQETIEEGTELVIRNLFSGEEKRISLVNNYLFSKQGNQLAVVTTGKNKDSLSNSFLLRNNLQNGHTDTVMKKFHEIKNMAFDEQGTRLVFVAERDSVAKALQKFYRLWYYQPGMDSAKLIADRNFPGVKNGLTISENFENKFSVSGNRLFFGLAPVRPVKDTLKPDFEKSTLDVWNYRDDDLQPYQLKNLERDLKKSYLSMYDIEQQKIIQLGNENFDDVELTKEGDGDVFYAASDSGRRVARQWQGFTLNDLYAINPLNGEAARIVKDFKGSNYPSYTGKYLLMYDDRKRKYSVYNHESGKVYAIATDIKTPLSDEENDVPDDPATYGIAGWEKEDKHVYLYDRYSFWRVDPEGKKNSVIPNKYMATARKAKISYRYQQVDKDEKYIDINKNVYFRTSSDWFKTNGFIRFRIDSSNEFEEIAIGGSRYQVNGFMKSDSSEVFMYTRENFSISPDLFCTSRIIDSVQSLTMTEIPEWNVIGLRAIQLSHLNPQQSNYLWGTASLYKWTAYTGKITEGILYKPENFDKKKKYPMIVYFYERNNTTLHNYLPPSPTPSRLNIPFFVSRGYVVFVPDIWYTTGHPGKNAYDYIVSGTRALINEGFIDSTKIGLQGQSWGGYQTAYVITRTNLYAAAWAGAPVVNMFSAYGGVRWESGLNRQFQYEKSQSRIGSTIWEHPELYIENSPLFHLRNVKTPLVIMSNDADGAVPWYQGIEFFTAMRRLGKPVWLLDYNGEAHNLVERRNRKDIQIREQQYFDWLLKGEKPPVWITNGVPATLKGIDWGLEVKQ